MTAEDGPRRRLSLGKAVAEGLSLAASRNGLLFVVAFAAIETITNLLWVSGSVYLPLDQAASVVGEPSGLPVGTPLPSAETFGVGVLTGGFSTLVTVPLSIIAIRTFVVGETERIPEDALFHRLGRATLSGVFAVVLIVLALAVLVGSAIGGLYVLDATSHQLGPLPTVVSLVVIVVGIGGGFFAVVVHVFFVTHEIAVRDRGVRDAFAASWALVRGNRARVFVLAVLTTGLSELVRRDWTFEPGGALDPPSAALLLVVTVLSAVLWVATTAVVARAYRQLSPDDAVGSGTVGN